MKSARSKRKILIPDPGKHEQDVEIRSFLSFAPYYHMLKEKVQQPNEQFLEFYLYVIKQLERYPELLQPINDPGIIGNHEDLFQLIASSLFPFSSDPDLQYYALGSPYKFEFFFYSTLFANYFKPDENGYVHFPPERPLAELQAEYDLMAYRLIFRKYFGIELNIPERRTNQWVDTHTGLKRYSRVHIDESFIEVSLTGELPSLPPGLIDGGSGTISDGAMLKTHFPLSLFLFEGFIIRRSIADVTAEECVDEVKNAIIEMQSHDAEAGYEKLRLAVETMIGSRNVKVSLNPFLKLNDNFIYHHQYSYKSILLEELGTLEEKEATNQQLAALLSRSRKALFLDDTGRKDEGPNDLPVPANLQEAGISGYLVAPLFNKDQLIGMMEAISPGKNVLNAETLKKLAPVFPYFEMACRNDIARFENEVETLILEKYTSLLPVVEWKFREEAWLYLKEKENNPGREIGTVKFNQVYPVYGAIDVRNSSNERRRCYQKDILEQLDLVESTLGWVKEQPGGVSKESIDALLEQNKAFREIATHALLPEDEFRINEFLGKEIRTFFNNVSREGGADWEPVTRYQNTVDPVNGLLNTNRRDFDESIAAVNATVARFLEAEQEKIQRVHPHYFEKFRSDGVEYIIYVGDSFNPNEKFELGELKRIRLWQLLVMCKITAMTYELQKNLPVPLETTQLVVVFDKPISISFRRDERRFDVEGQESVQFEILKKRVDKVNIKDTGERLTQPGTLAIVYSNSGEVMDYDDYFDFLKKEGLMIGEKEMYDLEDVQSITGLKAIRINVKGG